MGSYRDNPRQKMRGQMDMARSTQLVILIQNIYTLWGRKRFLLPVTYFSTNLVYPFTLRVTGIKSCHAQSNGHKPLRTVRINIEILETTKARDSSAAQVHYALYTTF